MLMLQAAQRRLKAKKVMEYKKSLKYWAAVVIQERYRRHKLRQKVRRPHQRVACALACALSKSSH